MLRRINDVYGYTIDAADGHIGKVSNFLFDDTTWKIRYLVVDTGTWLLKQKVLIPATLLSPINAQMSTLPVKLTTQQVHESPDIDTDKPVSLQHQNALDLYYQSGPVPSPMGLMPNSAISPVPIMMPNENSSGGQKQYDLHLRSTRHVKGYHIRSGDCQFGNVADFIISDENWIVPYMAINTINWLPSKWVLIPTPRIIKICWEEEMVHVDIGVEIIKNAPRYQPSVLIDPQYEDQLWRYYNSSE